MKDKRLTTEDLDRLMRLGCAEEGCADKHPTSFYIYPRCHNPSFLYANYNCVTKSLTLTCCQCEKVVAVIAVASENDQARIDAASDALARLTETLNGGLPPQPEAKN